MRRFTTASLALTIAATGLLAGALAVAAQDEPIKIGVVTDVGQLEDKSFNEFSNAGAMDAAAALGGEHAVIVTEEIADYASNIQSFVDEGFDVITTIGFLIGTDTLEAAKANPDTFFVGVDQGICVDAEGNNDSTFACEGDAAALIPNYQGIVFREAQPGYLVGIVAATLSESGVIGAVGGTNVPAVVAFRDGYINGAKSVNPDIEVLYQESNPDPVIGFNDPERGAEIAGQMLDLGADVIFQVAGGTGVGVLEAACAAGAYGIGVDVDQSKSLPPQAAECVVTSAEKKLQDTVSSVIQSAADGSFQAGTVVYDLSNDPPGVGISPFQEKYADLLTPELQAALDAAVAGMVDGSIDPGAVSE
jgi:basic membrane protein A and related proteins